MADLEQLRHGHLLQFADVRAAALDLLVAVVDLRVEALEFLLVLLARARGAGGVGRAAGRLLRLACGPVGVEERLLGERGWPLVIGLIDAVGVGFHPRAGAGRHLASASGFSHG